MPADSPPAAARLLVRCDDLSQVQVEQPCADAQLALQPGQARLHIERFALTANNITYAAFGESMRYWRFFPAPPGWGCVPVWGFATVSESRAEGLAAGERLYGYLPMATHLVVQAVDVGSHGFTDGAAHRQPLPAIYNRYQRTPAQAADIEGVQAVLRPLFTTAFLIDRFVAEQAAFGATTLLLSSASSKTAFATAFCMSQRAQRETHVVGLSSAGNADFARSLGCYDEVLDYRDWRSAVPAQSRTLYIDFSGDAALRRQVHEHFGDALAYSCAVGGTHWQALGSSADLPGPKPDLFFAPTHAQRLGAAPPQGLGRSGLLQQIDAAWAAFLKPVLDPVSPWLRIEHGRGADAVRETYLQILQGRGDPRIGHLLTL
jgi:hypothetical protein